VLPVPIEALAPEIDSPHDLAVCDQLAPLLDGTAAPARATSTRGTPR
jgi:hypothetical protein